MLRISEGDEAAFNDFFRIVSPFIKAYLNRILKDRESLSEVLQETFIRIWLYRDKLSAVEYILPYLKRIAANEAFTYLNKRPQIILSTTEDQHGIYIDRNEIEEIITYKETYSLVLRAIDELPSQRQQIYRMSRLQGLKSTEIAEQLQISESYVRNSISAALQFIRQKLADAGKLTILILLYFK